jgi:three-Cys-motif partner protein
MTNHHSKPFDEGTKTKLMLFETYTKEWLPPMIISHEGQAICVFDLFAGPGFDKVGELGTPIRILKQILSQINLIFQHKTKVYVWLNEFDKTKYSDLKVNVENYLNSHNELKRAIDCQLLKVKMTNCDFGILFGKILNIIQRFPSLVILDQNGIRFISHEYFDELCKCEHTDFMYFISSSYINRFGEENAFKMSIKIDLELARKYPYTHFHQAILEQLKAQLPIGTKIRLYPFTIKKNSNIYGIIFGASHPLAIDKFLRTAWYINEDNGCANFDIDDDRHKGVNCLFPDDYPNKIDTFKRMLCDEVLSGRISDNRQALLFTYANGHLPKHASDAIKQLKKDGKISYDSKSPMINYDQVFKNRTILQYKLIHRNDKN